MGKNILFSEHKVHIPDDTRKNICRHAPEKCFHNTMYRIYSSIGALHNSLNNSFSSKENFSKYNSNYNFRKTKYKRLFCFDHKKKLEYNNHGQNDGRGNPTNNGKPSIFVILGLAGIMKSFMNDEEQQDLTDEEKFNRMNPIEKLIVRGVSEMLEYRYQKANELFHKALRAAQHRKDEEKEFLILTLLATSYFENEDLEEAEKLFIALIKRLIEMNSKQDSPALLELSLKLAAIYSKNPNTHEKAIIGFKFVIDSLTRNLDGLLQHLDGLREGDLDAEQKNELALLGWTYDWYAKHLLSTNNYQDAVYFLKKALELSYIVLGPLHDQTLILLNDIGTTIAMSKSPSEGREYLQKAVDGAIESGSESLASFYLNLGLTSLRSEKFADGKKYCEESLRIAKKSANLQNSTEIMNLSKQCLREYEECDPT